ncbi:MAG: formylglycine-generating enzyme family protein [Wenzhouxiangellaceae bacterium]|nr:MAG: formylglycine-generating enzyme family protein [Wenzhouxiangellaceae bacterium]
MKYRRPDMQEIEGQRHIVPILLLALCFIGLPRLGVGSDDGKLANMADSELANTTAFLDCTECPAMVTIPAGSFVMGSPTEEPQRSWNEQPQRTVTVVAFALSQTAVTFAQWDACRLDGGCSHDPDDNDWGRGDRPVINVSWEDAQDYVAWLSDKTGLEYRLPSEAEWEYAARAGTTGRFSTGDCIGPTQANFQGGAPATDCPGGEFRRQTLPVASFSANDWGLHDMHGNVWEWVEDCWNWNYFGAPVDGSAWLEGDCANAVLRGGSWAMGGRSIRSASRGFDQKDVRTRFRGFRVARSVEVQ